MLHVEMLPAGRGDSLWIEWDDGPTRRRMLVDGGVGSTFERAIQPRLEALSGADRRLDLVVVTHIDLDHIAGVLELLREMPRGLEIGDLWFNGWKHLPEDEGLLGDETDFDTLQEEALEERRPTPEALRADEPFPEELGLLGPKQGEGLEAWITKRRIPWNQDFGGTAVQVEDGQPFPTRTLPGGLRLTVLGPRPAQLRRLRREWKKVLEKAGLEPGAAGWELEDLEPPRGDEGLLGPSRLDVERLARSERKKDGSAANGSSIALLLEHGDRRVLLTGDALPEELAPAMATLAAARGEERLRLDALKLSHHGGKKNTSRELVEAVACERFLLSTDGSYYDHPDPESVARVLTYRDPRRPRSRPMAELIFNYESEETRVWRDPSLERDWSYRPVYPTSRSEGLGIEL